MCVFYVVSNACIRCHEAGAGVGLFGGIGKRLIEIDLIDVQLDVAGGGIDLVQADVLIDEIEENDLQKPKKRECDDNDQKKRFKELGADALGLFFGLRDWFQNGSPLLSG